MDTYDSKMAARFRAALAGRAIELGAILGEETEFAREAGLHEVGDFKDAAVQAAIAGIDEAQARTPPSSWSRSAPPCAASRKAGTASASTAATRST